MFFLLPNIISQIKDNSTQNAAPLVYGNCYFSGAFTLENLKNVNGAGYGPANGYYSLSFDASDFNSIYGNSTTVQTSSLTAIFIIKF